MKFRQNMMSEENNHPLNKFPSIVCGTLLLISLNVSAQQSESKIRQQTIKIEETIRGNANQEQPKVLTIVPWQQPNEKQALPSPISERLNKQFNALERDEFRRQIRFFENQPKPIK
ncbi:MAG: hypothetical protein ACI808_001003 [Paraglaciecola sp.]|jgi:hypothetical protein